MNKPILWRVTGPLFTVLVTAIAYSVASVILRLTHQFDTLVRLRRSLPL